MTRNIPLRPSTTPARPAGQAALLRGAGRHCRMRYRRRLRVDHGPSPHGTDTPAVLTALGPTPAELTTRREEGAV